MAGITAAFLLPPEWPDEVDDPLLVVGIVLMVVGVGLVRWAHRSLGRGFTPFTRPPPGTELAEAGPYRLARHPMYGGALLFFVGLSLVIGVVALVLTAALALLWRGKSAVEERHLSERFPDYAAYRRRTPRRFLPGIY
jgi:protein-S-isoprenylcysteine O-methyltransferase Ste14